MNTFAATTVPQVPWLYPIRSVLVCFISIIIIFRPIRISPMRLCQMRVNGLGGELFPTSKAPMCTARTLTCYMATPICFLDVYSTSGTRHDLDGPMFGNDHELAIDGLQSLSVPSPVRSQFFHFRSQ